MPYILGLTGSIACGKTTVGLQLLELGADVYLDADRVVHELYLPGQPLVASGQLHRFPGRPQLENTGTSDKRRIVISELSQAGQGGGQLV